MKEIDKIREYYKTKIQAHEYQFCHYKKFDYSILKYIMYKKKGGSGDHTSFNDVIIMADTETSKKKPDESYIENGRTKWNTTENHIVIWTISLRAFDTNICTLWGRKPSSFIRCLDKIHYSMSGLCTYVFFHNFPYDYVFLRKFMFLNWGKPIKALNIKPHYPLYIEFANGLMFRDSLIIAQKKLEKWANDLDVEHKKAVGDWDYKKIRNQSDSLTPEELHYAEYDTLAGVECLDKTCKELDKQIYTLLFTATGIPRERTRREGKTKAHERFLSMAPTLDQYKKLIKVFHGGYTHGNRHFIDMKITGLVKCYDFKSSYPYIMLAFKFPMEKFTSLKNCNAAYILNSMNDYAFMFKFIAVNIRLKDDSIPMPALQYSKAVKIINPILDNGRVLAANYVEIYLNEYDLAVIEDQYFHEKHICTQVEFSHKAYLPRWFTDFVFESFKKKCYLEDGDPTAYNIAKSVVNSLYGMTVQHSIQDNIIEDYDYCSSSENEPYYKDTMQLPDESDAAYMQRMFEKEVNEYDIYLNKRGSILPYFWGVWVTSIAFYNLHQLVKCCETPYYCDTDSCYGSKWDQVKLEAYNQGCRDRITTNSYGAVTYKDRDIWLGIAESKGQKDEYSEFKYMGAKRYAGRCIADNELHITVAGVPKKKGALCLENDLDNFHPGFIFDGLKTGKTTHVYFYPDEIYTDENGNETGDSISLIPCDYELDSVNVVDWESLFNEKIEVQIYDEE